ncbi:hypothetical protein [Nitrospirillum amazonense]|nr:hypothetical protein [Nitrospirillum amazonense]
MADTSKVAKAPKQTPSKIPIGRMTIAQVDAALSECEQIVSTYSETVKAKLAANRAIPPNVLRELSRANALKGRLVLRRISQLLEIGEPAALELIGKLMKVQTNAG